MPALIAPPAPHGSRPRSGLCLQLTLEGRDTMLINFFYTLRAAKLPVSVKEYLTLLDAIKHGVIGPSVDDFYFLARTSLVKQTYNRASDTMSENKVDWATQRGWYFDIPAGEQINTRPTLAYGGLAFVSNVNGKTDCSANSYLYVVDALEGKKFSGAKFVATAVSQTSTSSGVTALLTTGQKIVGAGQDADGKPWERDITSGSPILPGKNAWMEIRRQ